MKRSILLLLAFVCLNFSVKADNIKSGNSASKPKVDLSYNGYNFLQLAVAKSDSDMVSLKIYDYNFVLLTSTRICDEKCKVFNLTLLPAGHYLLQVEKNGEDIYTDIIRKVR